MKKILFTIAAVVLSCGQVSFSQSLLKKISKNVTDEILGKSAGSASAPKEQPEPPSACADETLVADLGGNLKLDYTEISISVKDDGSILLRDRITSKYYVVKNGSSSGPFEEGSPQLAGFGPADNGDNSEGAFLKRNGDYIKKTGDRYSVTFGGKSYGTYAQVSSFAVTAGRDKFAMIAVENLPAAEADGRQMEEAMKNAKTDQERMDLAMKYSQQMQQKMIQGGGPGSMMSKLVTNVANASIDPMINMGGTLNGRIKYGDIVVVAYDKIIDLQGKTITTLKPEAIGSDVLFVNANGNRHAWYKYGTLTFSDGLTVAEMFNPHIVSSAGSQWLAYLYYSPKRNALMECKISF
jgi:hypothetical protein